ncbi:LytR C-terminal domain-containing protein [Demequina mangrovi]|uniref:LytR cell envelope-related transcriptional attenuator n=1 Tax=Demequina mangrovi TaxID=1043493 RepID=A0A1H6YCX5_9MICO|nr:LytR C-terminal domain-containing protein [Demequina mangrovi]SEJ38336.1 LytR cell envelope-related transcriptional attenuator [Demequina mangrovi]
MTSDYQRDEFDEIASSGGPVGVHRAPRPWWTVAMVPLVVFIVAGLVAFIVAQLFWNTGVTPASESSASPTVEATASAEPTAEASGSTDGASEEPTEEPSETPSETAEPEPVIDYEAEIAVLNGSGITGLAGSNAAILEDAGFAAPAAANLSGDIPTANRVVYADEAFADTADEVASLLGIDTVEMDATSTDVDVEVQLVSEP